MLCPLCGADTSGDLLHALRCSWPRFDGDDYVPARDDPRLGAQLDRIVALMRDERWRTLHAIADTTGDPPASISAQLRHLRKDRFGAHTVNRRYLGEGLFEYQVILRRAETGGVNARAS